MNAVSIPSATVQVPGGLPAIRATLAGMVALARQYKTNPYIRELAKHLVSGCPERDPDCEIAALQAFVRDSVRYTGDVLNVETLQTPLNTLGLIEQPDGTMVHFGDSPQAAGDCDDKCSLLAALMLAVGIPGRFCAIGVNGGFFSHVLIEARIRRGFSVDLVPLETIVPGVGPGWFPPDATCIMVANFG